MMDTVNTCIQLSDTCGLDTSYYPYTLVITHISDGFIHAYDEGEGASKLVVIIQVQATRNENTINGNKDYIHRDSRS